MKGSDPPHDYLQKSTRRRLLTLSAGALTTGLAGCSELGGGDSSSGSQLSAPDQTALQTYSNSYEWSQQGKEECDAGVETFRNNLITNDEGERVLSGAYPDDWPELNERMREAASLFADARSGFEQARRSAASSVIQSRSEEPIEWIDQYELLCDRFTGLPSPTEESVNVVEQEIDNFTPPLPPEELRNEL
jgi:hypothetical protein